MHCFLVRSPNCLVRLLRGVHMAIKAVCMHSAYTCMKWVQVHMHLVNVSGHPLLSVIAQSCRYKLWYLTLKDNRALLKAENGR